MKHRALIPLAVFALIVALFAAFLIGGKNPGDIPSALVGKPVPSFALPSALENAPGFDSAELAAARVPVIVNVFASWCVTCGAEHPVFMRLAKEGVPVYGMDYKDSRADVAAWLAARGNPYKAVGFDGDGRAAIDWGVYGVPETFVIAPGGIIRYRHAGPLTEEDYGRIIRPLLTELKG
jgi:cytochrome c biogenesis protein CcmG, thiol:disulfide interchange protein DsbE